VGNTVGAFMLKALILVFGFNIIYIGLKIILDIMDEHIRTITETYGYGWFFSIFVNFMLSLWSWTYLVLTNAMALAIILALSLIYEAYETKWR